MVKVYNLQVLIPYALQCGAAIQCKQYSEITVITYKKCKNYIEYICSPYQDKKLSCTGMIIW